MARQLTRLPFAPLERHLAIAALEHMMSDERDVPLGRPFRTTMALVLGVNVRQLYRWRVYGIDAFQADELAVRLGLHPLLLWPEWHEIQDPRHRWRHVLLL